MPFASTVASLSRRAPLSRIPLSRAVLPRLAALLCLAGVFGLAACAGREAPAEPQVKVRGQYDISVGVRR